MAGVFASFAGLLKSGDHIVAFRSIFGSTHQLLTTLFPRWGITSTYVDVANPEALEVAILPNTKMIFLETPSNPGLELVDLEWLCKIKEKYPNIIINVDNCFATPYLQKPIAYGVDIVSHSATKYMDGQGRVLGGVVCGRADLVKAGCVAMLLLSPKFEVIKNICKASKNLFALSNPPSITKVTIPPPCFICFLASSY